jgi:hypothetical protein
MACALLPSPRGCTLLAGVTGDFSAYLELNLLRPHSYKLFCHAKKVNSRRIINLQTLLAKIPGVGDIQLRVQRNAETSGLLAGKRLSYLPERGHAAASFELSRGRWTAKIGRDEGSALPFNPRFSHFNAPYRRSLQFVASC